MLLTPSAGVDAIRVHHSPDELKGASATLAASLRAADLMAHQIGSGWPMDLSDLDPELRVALTGVRDRLRRDPNLLIAELDISSGIMLATRTSG